MKNQNPVLKVTKVILNISFVVLIFILIGGVLTAIYNPDYINNNSTAAIIIILVTGFLLVKILLHLRQIVHSVAEQNPFSKENVNRFRMIGYSVLALGVFQAIVNFPNRQSGMDLIAVPAGSVGPEIFIFLVLGFLALLLAEIFAEALKIKNENDMTI
ncbi:DUF2975 domain-containing protein [Dethiobacter alkaliphilus]|uniref:DUF2975 domain-containing protein n=1 Tax=Dethiobacter alkaliphilus TaxID=427926 RepID=UPI0022276E40|nr:DUF2975 domain-containing protein [Dethiobacter alkaliphilus]MCW3490602.1 DUF2975 domain-containing protein [Dethiobacter alkaliphilus]